MVYRFVVESIENEQAFLKDSLGEVIVWPKNKLPENVNPGSFLYFQVNLQKDLINNQKLIAEDVLNEILNIS